MSEKTKTDSQPQEEPKRSKRGKTLLIVVAILIVCALGRYGYEKSRDVPLREIKTADATTASPDYANGVGLDYRALYNLTQEREVLPADENGWKLLLQSFGPILLEQKAIADRVLWEKVPTERADWWETFWKPACEIFGLDPNVKPTFFDRLDLRSYLLKNGITGTEPEGREGVDSYWENQEEKPGRATYQEYQDAYDALLGRTWTPEEFPVAAKWLEENQDVYDVLSRAVRSPKFRMWRFVDEKPGAFLSLLLPDVQSQREIARMFAIRAHYRIGQGDFSGALDDVESILLMGKRLLDGEGRCMVENLVGIALVGIAAAIGLDDSPKTAPTAEILEREAKLWRDLFESFDFEARIQQGLFDEHRFLVFSIAQDYAVARRTGGGSEFMRAIEAGLDGIESDEPGALVKAWAWASERSVAIRGGFNDQKYLAYVQKVCDDHREAIASGAPFDLESYEKELPGANSQEGKTARAFMNLLLPACEAYASALRRIECVVNVKRIANALLAHQADKGALPPAFTVDAQGKPLQSWRVLILPYLGAEEKALYDQIKLDEPWNSEANVKFQESAPSVYRCPAAEFSAPGETCYSALLGTEDAAFDESGQGKSLADLFARENRETANQALIVERRTPVVWTKPDEEISQEVFLQTFGLEAKTQEGGAGSKHAGGLNYVAASGGVRFVSEVEPRTRYDAILKGIPEPREEPSEDAVEEPSEEAAAN
ncbi:MAG: DUF1559 domain-containing protein [Thermoguttaceae bacterium]|nr:DUF1559 domain-containing protein [Thermoguttaceae bacterium]